jgi:hypothetical protein
VDFLRRLTVLVPRPRINLILYYGILGARAGRRTEMVHRVGADPSLAEPARVGGGADADRGAARRAEGPAWRWAALMRRTFPPPPFGLRRGLAVAVRAKAGGFGVLACPRCGGRLRLIALIEDAAVIGRILRHLGLPDTIPSPRPARAPPEMMTPGKDGEFALT